MVGLGLGAGAIFVVVAVIGFIFGMVKGAFRSLSDVVFVIFNAIASALISKGIAKAILNPQSLYDGLLAANEKLNNEAFAEFIAKIEPYFHEGEFMATADMSYILALPAILITPIIFMVLFFVFGLVLKIVKLIVQKLVIPKTRNLGLRVIGGAICAISNVLAVAIFIVPIIGYANYATNTVDMINETSSEGTVIDIEQEAIEEVTQTGAFAAISRFGGQWLFESLSTTQVQDVKVSLTNETDNIIMVCRQVAPLTQKGIAEMTEAEIAELDAAIDSVEDSQYLTALVSSLVSQTATELRDNNSLFTFTLPDYGETLNPVVQTFLDFCATMDSKGLVADLRTYADVFESMVKHGLFRELGNENGDLYVVLENSAFYSDILVSLYKNERTRPIVPTIADAMQSYLYEVYEEVNGFPYGDGHIEKIDVDSLTELAMNEEGRRIAAAVKEIKTFAQTIEGLEYVDDMVKVGDFAALGRGLNDVRDSVFFGGSYHFLIDTLLHSDACANIGIFDSNFVENAVKPDADMESLLLARQHLGNLPIAMWDGDKAAQEESLKILIEQVLEDDSDALKELASPENLDRYGVRGEKGETISAMATAIADTIHTHEYVDENGDGSIEDEKHAEAEKTAHILTVITNAHDNSTGAESLFDNGDGESKSGETADQLVDTILDSQIAGEMIQSAVNTSDTDPYKVQSSLSEADRQSLQEVLDAKYSTAESDADKQSVSNIASVFGIDLSLVP